MDSLNATHDPNLKSWIESANEAQTDFPIQNLPFCVFKKSDGPNSIGIGIGGQILNLRKAAELGLLTDHFADSVSQPTLNQLMSMSPEDRSTLREIVSGLLSSETTSDKSTIEKALAHQADVKFLMPCRIGDYTDFYASIDHATNVGSMFRPDNPILPNYKHIPIGYHGRASSVVVSGTEFRRPVGQLSPDEPGGTPTRAACKLLDYELEVAFFVAQGNQLGETIKIEDAEKHIFGMTLLNDWSARDIQKWEYVPLGPFLGKSFASTISPWVVTLEALAPFRCPEFTRPPGDPVALDYLKSDSNSKSGGIDLTLEVYLRSEKMREQGDEPMKLTSGSFTKMYWTIAQMLTHHSSNGCNMQPGDMLGSGTVSGLTRDSRGSLLELTWDGDKDNPVPGSQRTPLKLPTGEERKFLADSDEVIMKGFCENKTHRRIGFGTCAGTILPASG